MAEDIKILGAPSFDKLEIVKVATSTVTIISPSTITTNTVNHNLTYVPIIIAFIDAGSGFFPTPWYQFGTTAGRIEYYSFVDDTSVYLRVNKENDDGNDTTITFKYYLMRERAA